MAISGPIIAKPKKPRGQSKPKSSVSPVPLVLEWHWRDHSLTHKRMWRSDWGGDTFELIENDSFKRFRVMSSRLHVPLVDKNGDED